MFGLQNLIINDSSIFSLQSIRMCSLNNSRFMIFDFLLMHSILSKYLTIFMILKSYDCTFRSTSNMPFLRLTSLEMDFYANKNSRMDFHILSFVKTTQKDNDIKNSKIIKDMCRIETTWFQTFWFFISTLVFLLFKTHFTIVFFRIFLK